MIWGWILLVGCGLPLAIWIVITISKDPKGWAYAIGLTVLLVGLIAGVLSGLRLLGVAFT